MILASPDGQWAAVRDGRIVQLLAGGQPPAVGGLELDGDDVELAIVGPPNALIAVHRAAPRVVLHQPPYLEPVAQLELAEPMRLAAVSGPRFALVAADQLQVAIVRATGRALTAQAIDAGSQVEFVAGLERNQLLFGLARKLEVWDAVSGRPLLRLQLQLPPAPRSVGSAQGHLWVTRPDSDEVFVYRLSDGRPFRHQIGEPVRDVICHPASPVIVLVTDRGLIRLHCFAHALAAIETPWTPGCGLAQLPTGDSLTLLGVLPGGEPWQVPLSGGGTAPASEPADSGGSTMADKLRALRAPPAEPAPTAAGDPGGLSPRRSSPPPPEPAPIAAANAGGLSPRRSSPPPPEPAPIAAADAGGLSPRRSSPPPPEPALPAQADGLPPRRRNPPPAAPPPASATASASVPAARWRDPVAAAGLELARGGDPQLPAPGPDTELGELAQRLALSPAARRGLTVLYALYLAGEPAPSLARLAQLLGDWTEPLGRGELGALALLRRRGGRVALRAAATDLLDGLAPRAVRIAGDDAGAVHNGAARVVRAGRSDANVERELIARFGRIAVIASAPATAILEARLHDATAVALRAPAALPQPWPRDAGLIVVADSGGLPWVDALPVL